MSALISGTTNLSFSPSHLLLSQISDALAGVASWLGVICIPEGGRLIPGQATNQVFACLKLGVGGGGGGDGTHDGVPIDVFLSHRCFSSLPLSKNQLF